LNKSREGKRIKSSIFKALTLIAIWFLLICGCVSYLTTTINWFFWAGLTGRLGITALIGWGLTLGNSFLAVGAVKLNQILG
jgi:hypothetical protein